MRIKDITRKQYVALAVAFLAGAFWLFAVRFVTLKKNDVHYHANFGVFVDGGRLPFDNFTFYEEVQSCFGGSEARPQTRGHMHEQINNIVHVHDDAVTWGHFFANLGITVGDSVFSYDKSVYLDDETTMIRYYLNGDELDSVANRVIGNEDVLLITAGKPTDRDVTEQYEQIEKDANEYNQRQDPSSCSGGKPFTFWERVKAAVGFRENKKFVSEGLELLK